jgi:hypothetical protein
MKKLVIGIDPGKNGGIATIFNNRVSTIEAIPSNVYDLQEVFVNLGLPAVINKYNIYVFIENVHSRPTDGVRQAFTFGRGLGQVEGVLASMGLLEPFKGIYRPSPMEWMKYYNFHKEKNETSYNYKKRLKELALSECPNSKQHLITLATADALLIAKYGNNKIRE